MALFCSKFQPCLANALQEYPNVPDKIISIVGCLSKLVHILSKLVSLEHWFQVLTHEARKSRHRSAETLCEFSVRKSSASKNECKHFHRPLVRHLQTVMSLGAVELAEWSFFLPHIVLRLARSLPDEHY